MVLSEARDITKPAKSMAEGAKCELLSVLVFDADPAGRSPGYSYPRLRRLALTLMVIISVNNAASK